MLDLAGNVDTQIPPSGTARQNLATRLASTEATNIERRDWVIAGGRAAIAAKDGLSRAQGTKSVLIRSETQSSRSGDEAPQASIYVEPWNEEGIRVSYCSGVG